MLIDLNCPFKLKPFPNDCSRVGIWNANVQAKSDLVLVAPRCSFCVHLFQQNHMNSGSCEPPRVVTCLFLQVIYFSFALSNTFQTESGFVATSCFHIGAVCFLQGKLKEPPGRSVVICSPVLICMVGWRVAGWGLDSMALWDPLEKFMFL